MPHGHGVTRTMTVPRSEGLTVPVRRAYNRNMSTPRKITYRNVHGRSVTGTTDGTTQTQTGEVRVADEHGHPVWVNRSRIITTTTKES